MRSPSSLHSYRFICMENAVKITAHSHRGRDTCSYRPDSECQQAVLEVKWISTSQRGGSSLGWSSTLAPNATLHPFPGHLPFDYASFVLAFVKSNMYILRWDPKRLHLHVFQGSFESDRVSSMRLRVHVFFTTRGDLGSKLYGCIIR